MRNIIILLSIVVVSQSIPSPWFTPNSAWNAILPPDAPISSNSSKFVAGLVYQVQKYGPWINVEQYSVPLYTVPANQPKVKVNLLKPHGNNPCVENLRSDFEDGVPIPQGAKPAEGTDKHLAIWQPDTDTMWEFWSMDMNNQTHEWECQWGGMMNNTKSNPGFYQAPCTYWGATGTSLALTGGLLLIDEIQSGVIEHALPWAMVETLKGEFVPPAERGDGWSTTQYAIPEGTRFRLPADMNITALGLPPFGEMMARALQKYGGIVRDTSGAVIAAYCQPANSGPDPYSGPNGFFKGLYPSQILKNLPWDKFQVVDPSWQPWNGKSN